MPRFSVFRNSFCFDGCCFLHLQAVKKRANCFLMVQMTWNTCCRSTVQSRKRGAERYWGSCQGSLVHRTQRRAAYVMERSRRTRVRMHQRRRVIGSLSCERTVVPGALRWPAGRQESTADGRRLSNRVDGGFSCGRAACDFTFLHSGEQRRKCALGDSLLLFSASPLNPFVLGLFFSVLLVLLWVSRFPPSWSGSSPGLANLELCPSNCFKKFTQ